MRRLPWRHAAVRSLPGAQHGADDGDAEQPGDLAGGVKYRGGDAGALRWHGTEQRVGQPGSDAGQQEARHQVSERRGMAEQRDQVDPDGDQHQAQGDRPVSAEPSRDRAADPGESRHGQCNRHER
jgi:hypothetical protein